MEWGACPLCPAWRRESKQRGRKAWNLRKKKSRSVCAESKQSSLKQTPEKQFAFIFPQSAANMNGTASTPEGTKGIPMRRVVVKDPSHMPSHYSETPGGTLFSTTPGGTRIIYERKFLLDMRHSPLSKTPTKQLPVIPGVTLDNDGKLIEEDEEALENEKNTLKEKCVPIEEQSGNDLKKNQDEFQFDMDI